MGSGFAPMWQAHQMPDGLLGVAARLLNAKLPVLLADRVDQDIDNGAIMHVNGRAPLITRGFFAFFEKFHHESGLPIGDEILCT
jgi:hypothetical protein